MYSGGVASAVPLRLLIQQRRGKAADGRGANHATVIVFFVCLFVVPS